MIDSNGDLKVSMEEYVIAYSWINLWSLSADDQDSSKMYSVVAT
jgi:hypothetical protein